MPGIFPFDEQNICSYNATNAAQTLGTELYNTQLIYHSHNNKTSFNGITTFTCCLKSCRCSDIK